MASRMGSGGPPGCSGSEIHDDRLGRSRAPRERHELAIRRDSASATDELELEPRPRTKLGLGSSMLKSPSRPPSTVEAPLPNTTSPWRLKRKALEGLELATGELATIVERYDASPRRCSRRRPPKTVVGDDADCDGRDVGGDDTHFTAVLLMEKLPIQDDGSRG